MELTVDPNNIAAVKLYRDKLGFRTVEMRDNEYGKGHHRYIMRLALDQTPFDSSDSNSARSEELHSPGVFH